MPTVSTSDPAPVILITGISAAGKSTVAQHLAERFPRSVHLRGDVFRRMIVGGRAAMDLPLSPDAYDQLRLRYRLAATTAELYLQAGFTVVYQDVILGPDLAEMVQVFRHHPLHVVVLCPNPAVVAAREAGRDKTAYRSAAEVNELDRVLRAATPRLGFWLDSSELTMTETVERILMNLAEARVSPAESA